MNDSSGNNWESPRYRQHKIGAMKEEAGQTITALPNN